MGESITLASLNLWNLNDWKKRLPKIIRLIKKIRPDVICIQEAQKSIDTDLKSQIEILNSELGYPHINFSVSDLKHNKKGGSLEPSIEHGLGVMSRFPINTKIIPLIRARNDREKRILLNFTVRKEDTTYTIINLHFSNSDTLAENHFKETLKIIDGKNVDTILIGDFNIFNLSKYQQLYKKKYVSSSDLYKYISYPKDKASLDYILLPHKYEFESFVCRTEKVSDHRMIVAKIKLKNLSN